MSHRSNARALERLEKAYEAQRGGHAEVVHEADCLHRALLGITKFTRELAGTYEPPTLALGNYAGEGPLAPQPQPRPPLQPAGRVWTKDIRPGPHDVLTWQEVQRVPWIDGMAEDNDEPEKA